MPVVKRHHGAKSVPKDPPNYLGKTTHREINSKRVFWKDLYNPLCWQRQLFPPLSLFKTILSHFICVGGGGTSVEKTPCHKTMSNFKKRM